MFGGTTASTIILTNAYLGENKEIYIQAKIVDYYILTNNSGKVSHHIKIQDKQLDKIVDVKVEQPYQVGQTFNKTMKSVNGNYFTRQNKKLAIIHIMFIGWLKCIPVVLLPHSLCPSAD